MKAEYMSYKDAMNYLGFNNYQSLKELINAGMPIVLIGKSKRISKTAIDEFMANHTVIVGKDTEETK